MKFASMCGVAISLVSAVAIAQPGGDMAPAPGPSPAPPSNVDQGVVDDAMSPGAFLSPTALSEPSGTLTASVGVGADDNFNNSELTHIGVSVAVTDQITIGGGAILPTEDFRLGMLSAKWQFLRSGRLRLAVNAAVIFDGVDGSSDTAGIIGGAATYCLDDGCNSIVSGWAGAGFISDAGSGVPLALSGSIVYQVVPHFKVVGELLTGFATNDASGVGDGFLAFYGLRFTRKEIGVNVGFAKELGADVSTDGPGELFASVTGRVL